MVKIVGGVRIGHHIRVVAHIYAKVTHNVSNENKAVNDLTNQVKTLEEIVNSQHIASLEAELQEIKTKNKNPS